MKKTIFLITLLLLVANCVVLFACGGVDGTYRFKSVTTQGVTVNAGEKYNGITIDKDVMTVTLNKDGTYVASGMGLEESGVWGANENGGYVLIADDGSKQTCTINDNTMTFLLNGSVFALEK